MTIDPPDSNAPSDRTLAILDDLWRGERPPVVAKRHGVSLQWVHILRKRAGIPVPPRPSRTPRAPKVKVPKLPRPPSPRTAAIIADVQAGMLYREVGARHGVDRHTVFRIAKQHGVSRSVTDPDWRKHPQPKEHRTPRDPVMAAIVRDLRDGQPYADVAKKHGKPLKSIYNTVAHYGIGKKVDV